jgi:hypothetical protein
VPNCDLSQEGHLFKVNWAPIAIMIARKATTNIRGFSLSVNNETRLQTKKTKKLVGIILINTALLA